MGSFLCWYGRILVLFVISFFGLNSFAEKMPEFPKVSLLQGQATSERGPSIEVKLKVKDVLIERALLKVGAKSLLKIELNPFSSLMIFENTVVEIPVITWGELEIPEIKLDKGKIFYECEKDCHRFISTPLSRDSFVNGQFLLEYLPESPSVELTVIHGDQVFRGLENEETISVKGGHKVVFQGLKESGEVAYDFLLKGRKVARGKLQPIVVISDNEIKKLQKEFEVKRKAAKAGPPKPKRTEKQICEKPFGEFNQCTWTAVKKGKCQRRRCDANGDWVDAQETNSCAPKEKVAPCDY